MKSEQTFRITSNKPLTDNVYEMRLEGDTSDITKPGQFVNIKLPGFFLRRPISVCDWESDSLTLIYKVVGDGTQAMSQLQEGDGLDILTGLGNGFDTGGCVGRIALIGGGVGTPPMFGLAKRLIDEGKKIDVVLGFGNRSEVFYEGEFRRLTDSVTVCTVDGSYGVKGFVTDGLASLPTRPECICACGPMPMLRALAQTGIAGQISLEERMACGFGACMGCSMMTTHGARRVCKDGPVFDISEVIWQ